ncbi:MAG TPA: peptidoglycan-binding protein [Candidatus Udaeobacter sp.]|jgi:peptidoglycan hydrolase-like protein with peptidoglycan-binding domain
MKAMIAALVFIVSLTLARGDQMIESVQQVLKDQGFYYGEVTGQMSSDLTAAIRRYQIRSGLQVNGQLNTETLQSLGINSSNSAQPALKSAPSSPVVPKPGKQPTAGAANMTPAPIQPFANTQQNQQAYPSNPVAPDTSPASVLARTPFEAAPPEVQRNVIVSAQIALARRGLYHDEVNGVYGPAMELSLRAYQAWAKIPVTGRLDLETLAALRLLPRPREPFYDPAHRRWRRPPSPPVPGEWVPD